MRESDEYSVLPKTATEAILDTIGEVHSGILKMAARNLDVPVEDYILKLIVDHVREVREQFSDVPESALAALGEARLPTRRGRVPGPVEVRKEAYLEACYASGDIVQAIEICHISPSLPYMWARNDPVFREKWNDARGYCGKKPYLWPAAQHRNRGFNAR